MAGLVWQGRAHCGLDDAKNTARLLALLMHKGFKFSITNSLMCQTTDHSLMWKQSPEPQSFSLHQPQKLKDMHAPVFHYHPYCFCGVKSSRGMVRKPGPKQGSIFFGCGNWTAARGALCHYFEWASPWLGSMRRFLLIYHGRILSFLIVPSVKKKKNKKIKKWKKEGIKVVGCLLVFYMLRLLQNPCK